MRFRVALWENDEAPPPFGTYCHGALPGDDSFDNGICPGSDLIGRAEVTMSQADLVAALPNVGTSVDKVVRPSGGDGVYDLTYRITRLPDVGRDIVIGPATDPAISLQISSRMLSAALWEVTLGWSGAAANTVDINRNGVILSTTPNDGSHLDVVQGGTYSYRVCNAGTAICSPDVNVTVP